MVCFLRSPISALRFIPLHSARHIWQKPFSLRLFDVHSGSISDVLVVYLQQGLDVFHFFLDPDVAFFDGHFHLVKIHHFQCPQAGLDQDVRRFDGQVDARDALLHDVDGGHDGVDDVGHMGIAPQQFVDFVFKIGFRRFVVVGQFGQELAFEFGCFRALIVQFHFSSVFSFVGR